MGAKVSAETKQAIKLHSLGKSIYVAAAMAGIMPSTLYRALKRLTKKKVAKVVDRSVA